MSWQDQKQTINSAKEQIDAATTESRLRQIGSNINSNIKQYVDSAGISTNPTNNPNYNSANEQFGKIIQLESHYQQINKSVLNKIQEFSGSSNISSKLQELGKTRSDMVKLQKELDAVKQDAETSRAREETVKNPRIDLSWYQGFASKIGFTKALHQVSVPILMGFGVLMLFLSGLLLQDFFYVPVSPSSISQLVPSENIFSLFTDSRFYAVLGGITLVSTVLSILAYKGYLGKTT